MPERSEGVLGEVVGRISIDKWVELYDRAIQKEKQLEKELKRIRNFLEETKKAKYVIDVHKQEIKRQELEAELKRVKEIRVKLEWLATIRIKNCCWSPEILKEYEFIRDLGLLNKIRKEQAEYMCNNCNECSLIRVKTPEGDLPLGSVVKSRGIPYLPIYKLVEIRENRLKEMNMEVKETPLGALTREDREEIEKRIREKLALSKNVLNCIIMEKRVPLNEEVVLKHRKYGCHRKLPKWLPNTEIDIDGDPKTPDHFPEDVVAEIGEDGSYNRVYLSARHGSEESE
jgi:hypothetical protein